MENHISCLEVLHLLELFCAPVIVGMKNYIAINKFHAMDEGSKHATIREGRPIYDWYYSLIGMPSDLKALLEDGTTRTKQNDLTCAAPFG